MQMVLCSGPADELIEIRVGDKVAWDDGTTGGTISINEPDLFGGEKSEGGIVGLVDVNMGGPAQLQDAYLLSKLGSLLPAFRGVVSLVLQQVYLGTSTYIKPWEVTLKRIHLKPDGSAQWYDAKAAIPREATSGGSRTSRLVSDTVTDNKLLDMAGTTLAHLNAAQTALVIEDLRAGTVKATITLGYTPVWVYVSEGAGQTLVLDDTATVHAYSSEDGTLLHTFSAGGGLSPLIFMPTEITIGGTTYVFYWNEFDVACLSFDGASWGLLWDDFNGSFTHTNYTISAGPNYLYGVDQSGASAIRWGWTTSGLGSRYVANIASMGWSATATNAVSYIPDANVVVVKGSGGEVLVTSEDMTTSLGFSSSGDWSPGNAGASQLMSQHMARGSEAVFYEAIGPSGTTGAVYIYGPTGTLVEETATSEWGYTSLGVGSDSAFSETERALMVVQIGVKVVVLFFPAEGLDMNPAHIIRECITERMGYPDADIEDDSVAPGFTYAADTLYDELFGLTLKWSREEEIGEFINVVLAHIDAYLYISRRTGKFNLKLVRNDYDIDDIPVVTEDDVVEWTEVSRRGLADAVNSVTVKYTDRLARGKDASHQVDNIAQMQQMDGLRVMATRNYPGISTGNLAVRVAQRDVKSLGIGMISGASSASGRSSPGSTRGNPSGWCRRGTTSRGR
jgi:hypothetical protein